MRAYWIETRRGSLVLSGPAGLRESGRDVILMIHGFQRAARQLLPWIERFPECDVVLANLPGHGGAPALDKVGVGPWTEAFAEAVAKVFAGRRVLPVGESLGALIALGLPLPRIVAVEPFLRTEHLWPLHANIADGRERGRVTEATGVEALFGGGYHRILAALRTQALILAGDVPLMPERPCDGSPSLLDEEDFAAFAAHPLVQAHRVPGGHVLLDENPQACAALIARFRAISA